MLISYKNQFLTNRVGSSKEFYLMKEYEVAMTLYGDYT